MDMHSYRCMGTCRLEAMGYEAARQLDHLMNGETYIPMQIKVAPAKVVSRQSTDVVSAMEPRLQQAIRFMRANHSKSLSTDEIAQATGFGRRNLFALSKQHLDRTPGKITARGGA